MKLEYGIIIVVGILASVSRINFNPTYTVPHWEALHDMKQQSGIGCDKECELKQEEDGFTCVETAKNEYVCRPP